MAQDGDKFRSDANGATPAPGTLKLRTPRHTPTEREEFEQDITRTPQGFRQMQRDANSVNRQTTSQPAKAAEQERRTQGAAKGRELLELQKLEAWNAQMTEVDGLRMTNGEAQKARRSVVANIDHYAKWAVEKGHIKKEDQEKFKENAQRLTELAEKRGRGTITPDEEREEQLRGEDPTSKAFDKATRLNHEALGALPALASQSASADKGMARSREGKEDIDLGANFAAAQKADAPLDTKKQQPATVAASPQVSSTGFGL